MASLARDSAGIRVVENSAPEWDAGEAWEVAAEPSLRIGVLDGDSLYQFNEISDAVRLRDGTVVVGDRGDNRLSFYGPDGGFLRRFGRTGEGPGEFRRVSNLGLAGGDTIWVYDSRLDRFTYLTTDGELAGTVRMDGTVSVAGPQRVDDGSYVMAPGFSSGQLGPDPRTQLLRDTAALVRIGPRGSLLDTVGVFPALEIFVQRIGDRTRFGIPRFGRSWSYAADGHRVHVGTQDAWEIGTWSPDGELLRIVRRTDVDRVSTAAPRAEEAAEIRAGMDTLGPEARERAEERIRSLEDDELTPEWVPAYGRMKVDAAGHLWVAEHAGFGEQPRLWTVLDPEGRLLGEVTMPEGLAVYEIGEDYVLGRWTDELDVDYVVVHALEKGPGAG